MMIRRTIRNAECGTRNAERGHWSVGEAPRFEDPASRRTNPNSEFRIPNSGGPLSRRGTSLIEMVVAGILLSTMFMTLAPLLAGIGRQRDAALQQQLALQELANVMERVAARLQAGAWEQELLAESLAELTVSPTAAAVLDDPKLSVTVEEEAGPPAARRVTVLLAWKTRAGEPSVPLRLTAWFYRHEGRSP